jgi:hypothetical protein
MTDLKNRCAALVKVGGKAADLEKQVRATFQPVGGAYIGLYVCANRGMSESK